MWFLLTCCICSQCIYAFWVWIWAPSLSCHSKFGWHSNGGAAQGTWSRAAGWASWYCTSPTTDNGYLTRRLGSRAHRLWGQRCLDHLSSQCINALELTAIQLSLQSFHAYPEGHLPARLLELSIRFVIQGRDSGSIQRWLHRTGNISG